MPKPVFVSIGSFFFFGLLGFLISFGDAKEYWTHALLDPGRVGRLTYASNQAIRGTLAVRVVRERRRAASTAG